MTLNAYATVYVLCVTTVPSVEAGRSLVRTLVDRRLVACGTILPGGTSIYRWKDAVEEIVVPIMGGHKPYLDWLSAET